VCAGKQAGALETNGVETTMANNQNDRTPQNVSGQDQQKPQQGMPKDSGSQQKEAQPKSNTDRDMQGGKSGTDQARSTDQNQKR
jgi:hypothetical protein